QLARQLTWRDPELARGVAQAIDTTELGELIQRRDLLRVRQPDALDVLDQRQRQTLRIADVAFHSPDHRQPRPFVREPAPLAAVQLVPVVESPDDERLELAPGSDGLGETVERGLTEALAEARRARIHAIDGELQLRQAPCVAEHGLRGLVGNWADCSLPEL